MSESFSSGFNTGPNKRASISTNNQSMFGAAASSSTAPLGATSVSSATTTSTAGFSFGAGLKTGAPTFGSGFGSSSAASAIGTLTSTPAFGSGVSTSVSTTASTTNALGSSTTAFGTGNAFGSSSNTLGGSTSFLGNNSFKATSSFSLGASSSNSQASTCYPNLSIGSSPTDLKYSELLHKAFCLTQEHNIAPDTLVRDLPQEAQNIFSQIENFRAKEKESKAGLIKKMQLLAPSLGPDSNNSMDSPLPIEDKLTILQRDLKSLKAKLQNDAAITKEMNATLEAKVSRAKKAQIKLQAIKSKKEPSIKDSRLNPLGNVPFSQLITSFSHASYNALGKSLLADSKADTAYDEIEYFIQLHKDIQAQGLALKAEILKIQKATNCTVPDGPTPQILKDQLLEKIIALGRQELSIRHRLNSVLKEHNLNYLLAHKKSEPEDDLTNILFDQNYVPRPKQDDILFEIATSEVKQVDLSKLKRK